MFDMMRYPGYLTPISAEIIPESHAAQICSPVMVFGRGNLPADLVFWRWTSLRRGRFPCQIKEESTELV